MGFDYFFFLPLSKSCNLQKIPVHMRYFIFLFAFILSLFASSRAGLAQSEAQIKLLDGYYQKSLTEGHIPGMAIAIVSGDSIVFAKGYGYADLASETQADENTLFAIASNSKAFTASALAQLVDRGLIQWDDKVIDYLPYFKSYDPYVTAAYTIEDLLSHRGGLKTFSGDLLWYATDLNPEEIIIASHYLEPMYDFRAHFGYSNINYLAAGMILETLTDTTWADYVQHHFLSPLGMDRTLTSTSALQNASNVATPYFFENGKNHPIEWVNWDNIAPAGALISSVSDYAHWIKLILNRGVYHGKTYLSDKQFEIMTTPHINYTLSPFTREYQPSKHFSGYGLGWELMDYHGYKVISHSGGYDGMISRSCIVPEKKLGFIILTNNLNWLTGALMNKTLDVLLANQNEGTDWSALYSAFKSEREKQEADKQAADEKQRGLLGNMLHKPEEYTGIYTDKIYGDLIVELKGDQLLFRMTRTSIFSAELNHWNFDIFTFRFNPKKTSLPSGKMWFESDKNGTIVGLKMDVPNPDFFFTEFDFKKQNEP